ncbi:MAG: lytic transglycosylase domain-containing protein [Magnetococcales bacterium]|nr:lytic transglycosylase domain-containing protein [Magnetococcales bacterium]
MLRLLTPVILAMATLLVAWPGSSLTAEPSRDTLEKFRGLFRVLEGTGPIDDALDRSLWPRDELLASYLELELLFHPRTRISYAQLRQFLSRYPAHPQIPLIKPLVDRFMTDEGTDAEALAWYDRFSPTTSKARLRYLRLLLAKQRMKEAGDLFVTLYRAGASFPGALDTGVRQFQARLTADDHEARARQVLKWGSPKTFEAQLKRIPDPNRRAYLEALAAAHRLNTDFFTLVNRLPPELARSSELWYTRMERLRASGFDLLAMELLNGPQGKYLAAEDRHRIRFSLGQDFLFDKQDFLTAFTLLDPNAQEMGAQLEDSLWLAGWSAYRAGYKEVALAHFRTLGQGAPTPTLRAQGAYWAASLLGFDHPDSRLLLQKAADFPETFYGLLAFESLYRGLPDLIRPEPQCDALLADPTLAPELARMELLRQMERSYYNGGEIEALAQRRNLGLADQVCLANHFGAPNRAIKAASELLRKTNQRVWTGLYPPLPWKPALGWSLDPSVVAGTTRQESLFANRVNSRVGAAGLMQLMPATAREEARLVGLPEPTPFLLQLPAYNLSLGQSYLSRMLAKWNGDLVLALVSYNAGPHRAGKWRAERLAMTPLEFMESIRFKETRNYVKLVIHGMAVYRQRLRGSSSSLQSLLGIGQPGLDDLRTPVN